MAISLASGFSISNSEPIDSRLIMTKAEMLAIKKAKMPKVYLAMCPDDGKLYLYNGENEINPETGRFRVFEGGNGNVDVNNLVSNDSDNAIFVTEDNQIKVIEQTPIEEKVIRDLFEEEIKEGDNE